MNDISKLDVELVEKIAEAELDYISYRRWHDYDDAEVSSAVARSYLRRYLESNDIFDELAEQALSDLAENELYTIGGTPWSPEFAVGHGLAVAARNHACADLDLCADDFFERATSKGGVGLLDRAGAVWGGRLEGVNMERPYRSARECTPQMVMSRARDMECELNGRRRNAAELITLAECEQMAKRLMGSRRERELDYADFEDLDVYIADCLEELGCENIE